MKVDTLKMPPLVVTGREPIVGQPKIHAATVSLSFSCTCGHILLLSGAIGVAIVCGGCKKKAYRLNGAQLMPNGDVAVNLQSGEATERQEGER